MMEWGKNRKTCIHVSRSQSLFEVYVFIQRSCLRSWAAAQQGILWERCSILQESERRNEPTLAASGRVRWLNKADEAPDTHSRQALWVNRPASRPALKYFTF